MIDIVLQGSLANLRTLLRGRGLIDANDNPMPGFDYCLWAGNGKFMTARPATYMAGFVVLARVYTAEDAISEGPEQWERSQVAKWIKTNGTLGTFGGFPCYTVNSVRMMHAADVFSWCTANNMPAHEWCGGNTL